MTGRSFSAAALANRSSSVPRSSDPENPSGDRHLLDFVESETSVGCYSPDDHHHLHRSCDSAIDVSPPEIRDSFVRHVASENCAGLENCVCGNGNESENDPDDPYDAPKDCDSSSGSCDVGGETCFDLYPDFDPPQQARETCDGVAVVVVVGMSPFVDEETDLDVELERSCAVPVGNVCELVLQLLEMLRDELAAEIPFPWREVLCRDSNGQYSDHDHLLDLRVAQILPRNHHLPHSSVGSGQDDEADRVIRDVSR